MYEEQGIVSFVFIVNNKFIDDSEFVQFIEQQCEGFYKLIDELENWFSESLFLLFVWKWENLEQLCKLNWDIVEYGIWLLFKELEYKYFGDFGVFKYLWQLKFYLIEVVIVFLIEEFKVEKLDECDCWEIFEEYFLLNVICVYSLEGGVLVVYEFNLIYQNLFGLIEYIYLGGVMYINYKMICLGVLYKVNGGYLLFDVDQLLYQFYVWEVFKLVVKFGKLKMDLL